MNARLKLAVVVATADRADLLANRALPSVASQTLSPSQVVVVDDSQSPGNAEQTARCARDWNCPDARVAFLRNRRTKGAAGAWNSALDHLLRHGRGDPSSVYVAILDDDDRWLPEHLAACAAAIQRQGLDMVATPFWRIEGDGDRHLMQPPTELLAADFLIGNPGIQGSNLVCRLGVLLEAGLFDEALPSCTDRDLCIRIADLPDVAYGVASRPTVEHFACRSRQRLSTPVSHAKQAGLNGFFRKCRLRMSSGQRASFARRAEDLFGWRERGLAEQRQSRQPDGVSLHPDLEKAPLQAPVHLVVGAIAGGVDVSGLLADIRGLVNDPDLSGLDVVVFENTKGTAPGAALRCLVERERAAGLRVHLVDRQRHRDDAERGWVPDGGASKGERLPIGPARTVLQCYLYAFAKDRPGSVVWIVDDDMRLDPLAIDESGAMKSVRQPLAQCVRQLRRLRAAGSLDVAIGLNTGAPPLPFASTIRVQLVDLAASLFWLRTLSPSQPLPDLCAENATLREGRADYYYDLSRKETDRLESPFWLTPEHDGETAGKAFLRIATEAARMLAGDQVFRPLAVAANTDPLRHASNALRRGGNTFVFDVETLRLAPNPAPMVSGRRTRRSDMIWALLQRRYFDKKVMTLPLALHHDRSGEEPDTLDEDRVVDDIRGYAFFSALDDLPDVFLAVCATGGPGIRLNEERIEDFTLLVDKYAEERLAAFRLSFHRVRGLAKILAGLLRDDAWWRRGEYEAGVEELCAFCRKLESIYTPATLTRIEREVWALGSAEVREFLAELPRTVAAHRARLRHYTELARGFEQERVANAKAVALRLASPSGQLRLLGCGKEGVALTDGLLVYKVFDFWWKRSPQPGCARGYPSHVKSPVVDAPVLLRSLVDKWPHARFLYPLKRFEEAGHQAVLAYPFEESEPYRGGCGPGLVGLLVECHRYGIVCRNIDPDNLRVVDGRVRLIDYGSDIHLRTNDADGEKEFRIMCQRAWLSYRFAAHDDLNAVMRRALQDQTLPHLDGFERFFQAVQSACDHGEPQPHRDFVLDLIHGGKGRVLDYGCGNGKQADALARRGFDVVAYDIDQTRRPRWKALSECPRSGGSLDFLQLNEALDAAPYDVVLCRRVFCEIEEDQEFHRVLAHLRCAVKSDGRVFVSCCNPLFTFGGETAEAKRLLPPDARYEATFAFEKRMRGGRLRKDVHRPERALRRAFARAGFAVVRRVEDSTVDWERFEPASDHVAFELRPLPQLAGDVTLLVKACAMDADTLDVQVRHLVSQLETPRAFAERLLVLDSRERGFTRPHARGDLEMLRQAARRLRETGWIDRVLEGPEAGPTAAAINRCWFGVSSPHTHSIAGAQIASTLAGFEACATPYILQVDVDAMVGRLDRAHDYLAEMIAVFGNDPNAITVAFNIAQGRDRAYTAEDANGRPWRTEVRACLFHRQRLLASCPWPNEAVDGGLALSWHRSLDVAISKGAGRSHRGGDQRTFYVHPPNRRKADQDDWFAVLDRLEKGIVPSTQLGAPEWQGALSDWLRPARQEPFVFVVCGRNVAPGRLRRCFDSMRRQRGPRWGAVIVDDASAPAFGEHFENAAQGVERATVIRNRRRRGLLANMVTAIRSVCVDPETVIVTLDADDALIGDDVLLRLAAAYRGGADATVGSMLRTDKRVDYPVCFERPREHRGGNVWQHLRSFKKRLFDAIPDDALRLDGEYVDLANDWAYMLPIAELAEQPTHIETPLYLYEPANGAASKATRIERDAIIARIVAKTPMAKNGGRLVGQGE